ncbi:MAG: mannose-6-phosphate isomerase [Ruminococcaceae bacterium]|nr:mannose-6-phosphate isomerase [Oscillospiraceae bacterium]
MNKIYKLTPSLHANIWGGDWLKKYKDHGGMDRIGESWELSFVPGSESKIDGKSISEIITKPMTGRRARRFEFFPVLTKFIDAREKLSVQVHPNDDYALDVEGQYGKTEMWYVVSADEGAGLYMGLKRRSTPEEVAEKIADESIEELLSFKEVKAGDVFFIPSGTIHAIGAGVRIFEIQQNSTLTYRLYDYGRRDASGNKRELHVEKALDVLIPDVYRPTEPKDVYGRYKDARLIGKCDYFTAAEYTVRGGEQKLKVGDATFLCLTVIEGAGVICPDGDEKAAVGLSDTDTVFIPADKIDRFFTVKGDLKFITVEL